jgi:hypothetical protein
MSVANLSAADLALAVDQIVRSPAFAGRNLHLSAAELAALRQNPPLWPIVPVFSPYAITHDGYSQSESTLFDF